MGAFGGALLFMFSEALGVAIRSNPPPGELGVWLSGIQGSYPSLYNNTFSALPYILTIIVLAGVGASDEASAKPVVDAAVRAANATLGPQQRIVGWRVWPEDDFPRTHTLKIRRDPIRAWAAVSSGR